MSGELCLQTPVAHELLVAPSGISALTYGVFLAPCALLSQYNLKE
jgi:hypothetical protein